MVHLAGGGPEGALHRRLLRHFRRGRHLSPDSAARVPGPLGEDRHSTRVRGRRRSLPLCTLFLGEVRNFYERYWWWDIVLHTGSAVAFGLVGVILMLILVRGEKLTAAPVTVSFFGFCFAVTIGAAWEIWEFFLDQTFGMNTQKSGLIDTMWDLIVDCLGAAVGAIAGYIHLKGWRGGPLAGMIRDFVERNRRFFGKNTGA